MRNICTAAKKRRFIVSALLLLCLLIILTVVMTSARAATLQKQTGSIAGHISWGPSEREGERGARGHQGPQRSIGLQASQGLASLAGSRGSARFMASAGLAWPAGPSEPAILCTICDVPSDIVPAALSLGKMGVRHGNVISYTLLPSIVGNTGLAPGGTVITLTDTLPTQVTLIPGSVVQSFGIVPWTINISGNTLTETLMAPAAGIAAGTLLPSITFDTLINVGTRTGTIIENEATISAAGFAPVTASSTIELGEQQIGHPCREERNECRHHMCPRVAGWGCEACPHVANWPCEPVCAHVVSHDCDPKDHNSSDAKSHSGNSNAGKQIVVIKESNGGDAKSHSGNSNGGKQILIIKEEKSSSRSHSSSLSRSNSGSHSGSRQSHHVMIVGGLKLIRVG